MASSSSTRHARSIVSPKLYDVFISHRGPDVKHTLAKKLYDLLKARECKAFLDREEIEGGDSIPSAIENGILSSRVQIAIFSKRYAESSWCLDELVLMLKQTDALFIPVFYDVQPWELRHIDKKSQYATAFSDYQQKGRNLDKLDEWKEALVSASNISGYELSEHQDNLSEKIVSRVVKVVQEKSTGLHVAKYPVGLDELVQDFERCCSRRAGMVGIFGLGGVGKTTLAKELFNRKHSGYNASCFVYDVRESHTRGELHCLQRQLLKDLFKEDQEIRSVDHGMGKLKDHLGRARHLHFLIILDDIDHESQLDALLPERMLGFGNLIIITTREKSVLRGTDCLYKMKGMDKEFAKELFCSHAFDRGDTPAAYEDLLERFVKLCGGLPLSLIVLSANVYRRDEKYWEQLLEKVKKIQPKDITQRLRISFDGLDIEEKQIFVDIACFFNKKGNFRLTNNAIRIWNASGWSAEHALQTLKDKCLVEVNLGRFEMHDHLRDLGRQMADQLGPPRVWRPDLLRSMEAKGLEQILTETKGRCFHSLSDSSLGRQITYFLAETDLLWLEMYGTGDSLPMSIPSWIPLWKLQILNVLNVEELWSCYQQQLQMHPQASFELRELKIYNSPSLQKLPELIEMFSHLEELDISNSLDKTDTTSLVQSIKQLGNLRSLELWFVKGASVSWDFDLSMDSLETIILAYLQNISKLVLCGEMCPRLQTLIISQLENLEEMKLNKLERLNTLYVISCPQLETISGLSTLIGLEELYLCNCARLICLLTLSHLRLLENICIDGCRGLKSVEGPEALPGLRGLFIRIHDDGCASWIPYYVHGLRGLFIRIPDDGCASWIPYYVHGLKTLPVNKIMRIIVEQKATSNVSSELNAKLFSEVIGAQEVSEIERGYYGDDKLKMSSSSSAITIYALHVTSRSHSSDRGCLDFEFGGGYDGYFMGDCLIIVVLTQHDIEGSLSYARVKKGFKVTMKVGEEGKAVTVLQRIADRLYPGTNLATNDVAKKKRKQMN